MLFRSEALSDRSGSSVSISSDGNTVAIGAPNNDDNGTQAGHVRVYHWNESNWDQLGSDIDGESPEDFSGGSVSISSDGNIIAIGATGNDGNGNIAGHVRVFEYSAGNWIQMGSDIDGETAEDQSGFSVSLSSNGNTLAIGNNQKLIPEINSTSIKELIENETITGGMIPKINNCLDVASNGVKGVVIIDGRKNHSILFELLSDKGSGTLIRQ